MKTLMPLDSLKQRDSEALELHKRIAELWHEIYNRAEQRAIAQAARRDGHVILFEVFRPASKTTYGPSEHITRTPRRLIVVSDRSNGPYTRTEVRPRGMLVEIDFRRAMRPMEA